MLSREFDQMHPTKMQLRAMVLSLALSISLMGPLLTASTALELPKAKPNDIVDEDVDIDTTWDPSGSPYMVGSTIRVLTGATLTVIHGTEVHFSEGAGLIVEGTLKAGDEGGETWFKPAAGANNWNGIRFDGTSTCVFERVGSTFAKIGFDLNSSGPVWIRNSTIRYSVHPLKLTNSSRAAVSNSTLVWDNVRIVDPGSSVLTFSYLEGLTVDHAGAPRGGLRVEVTNKDDDLMLSYIVNQTGEVPPFLLQGFTINSSGRDRAPGTYIVAMSDDPFTHYVNLTLEHNGTFSSKVTWRFNWPPALTKVPVSMKAIEDHPTYYGTEVLDRNGAGSVSLNTSSSHVTYDVRNKELKFDYRDETISNETVQLTLDDGYDRTNYTVEVLVSFWPDSPRLEIDNRFIKVTEDIPVHIELEMTDEDTPLELLDVATEDPMNITYISTNTTLLAVFPDGAAPQFEINVTVTDGTSYSVKELVFIFTGVFYPPYFNGLPTELVLTEDTQMLFDLTPFIIDRDLNEGIYLKADSLNASLFSTGVISDEISPGREGYTLLISPQKDAYGTGRVSLTLTDEGGLNTTIETGVRIDPLNDAPLLDSPKVEPLEGATYRFLVTYLDVDGDQPVDLYVSVDGTLLPMTGADDSDTDLTDGKVFKAVMELEPGNHSYSFIGSDGRIAKTLDGGYFTTPEVLLYDELRGYDGLLGISTTSVGKGPVPVLTTGVAIDGQVEGAVSIGCSFRLDVVGREIRTFLVRVEITEFRNDIIAQTSRLYRPSGSTIIEVSVPYFNRTTGVLTVTLDRSSMGVNLSIWAELDPDLDSDQDGVPNFRDRFPEDRNEWNDTDSDGQGDNSDDDDDDDGFPDTVEVSAGSNPRSAASIPKDTDSDGTLDYLDEDDDGDGMPDVWEIVHLLDPLDPLDAALDPDKDALTNLEEYRRGTDPNIKEEEGNEVATIGLIILIIALVVVLLLIAAFLVIRMNRRPTFELDEGLAETVDDEWEVQGELEKEDAVECPDCKEYYPFWTEKCPFCGSENPMQGEE